jgi:ubiquitin C-terminal hydrolase
MRWDAQIFASEGRALNYTRPKVHSPAWEQIEKTHLKEIYSYFNQSLFSDGQWFIWFFKSWLHPQKNGNGPASMQRDADP